MALSHNNASYMANNTPVVSPQYSLSELELLPVEYPCIPLAWRADSYIGDTWSFCLHHVPVCIYGISLRNSVCCGRYCDRRVYGDDVKSCACYTANQDRDSPKVTMEVSVRVFQDSCPEQIGYEIDTLYTSYSLLKWCIHGNRIPVDMEANNQKTKLRVKTAVNEMVRFVNKHGGFTVIGWATVGEVGDPNNPDAERMRSDRLTVHVGRLVPTSLTPDEVLQLNACLYKVPDTLQE